MEFVINCKKIKIKTFKIKFHEKLVVVKPSEFEVFTCGIYFHSAKYHCICYHSFHEKIVL